MGCLHNSNPKPWKVEWNVVQGGLESGLVDWRTERRGFAKAPYKGLKRGCWAPWKTCRGRGKKKGNGKTKPSSLVQGKEMVTRAWGLHLP